MARRTLFMNEIQEVLYRIQKKISIRSIARSLKISRNTVKRILREAKPLGFDETIGGEKLEEISLALIERKKSLEPGRAQAYLKTQHEQIALWWQMPHMTATQMVRLFEEQGKKVSERSLGRYIKKHFPSPVATTVHLETKPGKQGQVDFAYVGMMKDQKGKLRKAYAFIMTLSHSRYRFVRFVFRQDVRTWIDCHIRAFHFFGGVPETIVLDNLKAGITLPDFYDPVSNRTYGELERHYSFIVDPAKIRTPQHKGKVERSVTIARQQILAGRTFKDIEEANEYALHWCRHEISQRITTTTGEKPYDLFIREEKPSLKPLPKEDYECPQWQSAKVHRDQHIVFEGSFYSLPTVYVGQDVWIRAGERILEIFHEEKRIKSHIRTREKGKWITDKKDYPFSKNQFLEKDKSYCLKEADRIGPSTYEMIEEVLTRESLTTQRKAQAILRLEESYGSERLESCCKRALSFNTMSYKSLKGILCQGLDQPKQEEDKGKGIGSRILEKGSYLRNLSEFALSSFKEAS